MLPASCRQHGDMLGAMEKHGETWFFQDLAFLRLEWIYITTLHCRSEAVCDKLPSLKTHRFCSFERTQ